jgi:hypothetical protein
MPYKPSLWHRKKIRENNYFPVPPKNWKIITSSGFKI